MTGTLFLVFILGVIVLMILIAIGVYNRLVAARQTCNQGWADIDAQLKQRHDLIPNLVATVKGYAAHEQATLDAVIAARNGAMAARTPDEAAAAEGKLSGALNGLMALGEAYPDLKASANFQTLQHELADVEDKLAAARRAYNGASAHYNSARESFPAVLFAASLGFAPRAFWELSDADRTAIGDAPQVSFTG